MLKNFSILDYLEIGSKGFEVIDFEDYSSILIPEILL